MVQALEQSIRGNVGVSHEIDMGKKMDTMAVMMIFAIIIYTGQAEPDYTFSGYKNTRSSLLGIIFFPFLFHAFFLSLF